ncbi:putative 1-phosphatidylinositol-3-phosphate 5-kinase FAB1D isoform X2 [Typha latifolia]|uniref:putative 1-phosphatidylinositol-3-phosphate 5-kinase FAB1D isoform X2 n=1 Tax=Typha latifolia TaxID=4733 RepID=UPI003C2CE371
MSHACSSEEFIPREVCESQSSFGSSCSEVFVRNGTSPYATPVISPAPSLISYASCSSNNGDFPVEMSAHISREEGIRILYVGQNYGNLQNHEHSKENGYGDSVRDIDIQPSKATITRNGSEKFSSDLFPLANHEDGNGEKVGHSNNMLDDGRSIKSGDDSDETGHGSESISQTLPSYETEPNIWIPPEPADVEDDIESVANIDDDDDYSDGTKWGQPSFLTSASDEHWSNHNHKEERQKAMLEAMNGQFRILVFRFLESEGISYPESWLDMVVSLSWKAALLIKPDASEGKEMDPCYYVKVKCIASGDHEQSQVINGLVFKKNTAHKHMPTKFENPRLLLLQGVLGHSDVGLSSFNSMEQEKDHLEKSLGKMMEICHPNVILVEKTVSRDIQELLLKKGVTLVLDMKIQRLERIARCTGSPIISFSDVLMKPKLKQCDSFHIEKFVEEHNGIVEGGKIPSKTLMFLEGFPKPLGCTILLRGANSEELKKVKHVIHYTVFAAYHLILETSFFADQRVFLTDKSSVKEENSGPCKREPPVSCDVAPFSDISSPEGSSTRSNTPALVSDIPISDGSAIKYANEVTQFNGYPEVEQSSLVHGYNLDNSLAGDRIDSSDLILNEPFNSENVQLDSLLPLQSGRLLSSVSGSLKKFLGNHLRSLSTESISSYLGLNLLGDENTDIPITPYSETSDHQTEGADIPITPYSDTTDHEAERTHEISQEEPDGGALGEVAGQLSGAAEKSENQSTDSASNQKMHKRDEIGNVLDPESILILMSSQCVTKQAVCEQSHLSRIKYYGNFDISLGRYLRQVLLNQKHSCPSCGEPPEAHVYNYTHSNGKITVLVRRLPPEFLLSGEAEGKIWMWSRCLRCERETGIAGSTPRVVISTSARNLSFGKFLELSFSSHSAARKLCSCGHSLHRDCLRFFGLGSKVAMFRYSAVEIYSACMPPPALEFHNPNRQEWLKEEVRTILARGNHLFSEIANSLQQLKNRYPTPLSMKCTGSTNVPEFSEAAKMLLQDRTEFEASLKAIEHRWKTGVSFHEILALNWLYQDLLLELYVWDHRLHQILQCNQVGQGKNAASRKRIVETNMSDDGPKISEDSNQISLEFDEYSGSHHAQDKQVVPEVGSTEIAGELASKFFIGDGLTEVEQLMTKGYGASLPNQDPVITRPSGLSSLAGSLENDQEVSVPISDDMQADSAIKVIKKPFQENITELEEKIGDIVSDDSMKKEYRSLSQDLGNSKLEDSERWIWTPSSELQLSYRKDLQGGSPEKFNLVNTYSPSHLSPVRQRSTQGSDFMHFTIGPGGNVLSISEDEISSIIAHALAKSEEQRHLLDITVDKEAGEGRGEPDKLMEKSNSLISDNSVVSSSWSSTGSLESENYLSSLSSLSYDELTSGSDGSYLLASQDLHPEITINRKVSLKSKYTVVCIHANQFYTLRKKCCPSELAYISSLSRCKKWDAQGGKSKALFAKTMDDRFIIKQIKKTEFDSFLKFSSDYFKHVSLSLDSGSQTCLAKILGIYQVRQIKNGKEIKIDLMVMENLLFGRNVSRTYDLKGAVFSRHISDSNNRETVFLDQNFIEDMQASPIYIGGKIKHLLQRAIWNDTAFLTSINVMDYSLLVGVDKQRHELVFGIIDYLRQYTWDKQLETWVKSSLVVPKNALPTVISPKEYKKRFRKFMTKYFLTVPDSWSSEQCSTPCKICSHDYIDPQRLVDEKPPEQPIEACA